MSYEYVSNRSVTCFQTNNCGTSLAVSASCVINVSFTPAAAGDRTGQLTIVDNAPGSPHAVSLDVGGSVAHSSYPCYTPTFSLVSVPVSPTSAPI
jgi:hypothetical protein